MSNTIKSPSKYNASSPYSDRMAILSQKINVIHNDGQTNKESNTQSIFTHLHSIEDKLTESSDTYLLKLTTLKEQINKTQNKIEDEQDSRDNYMEAHDKAIKTLELKIFEKFENESNLRKEMDKRITAIIDDKLTQLKIEMEKVSSQRDEDTNALNSTLQSEIPKIQEAIKIEEAERTEISEHVGKKFEEELQKVNGLLSAERKGRTEMEEEMVEMVKEMVGKSKSEVEKERKERQGAEDTLLSLIESTCAKISASK